MYNTRQVFRFISIFMEALHLIVPLTLPHLTFHQGYLHIYSISH